MIETRKICVVTGTRAEYGLLKRLMLALMDDPAFRLQIIATGMHLSPEFGLTYKVIEADGFTIDEKVEMLLSSDTPKGISKSIGLGVIGFADAFERLKPDMVVLLGDRFEILAAAEAALIARIPVSHLAGGDTTEGAFDEAIRHSITKMSHLHFVTNDAALRRVRQLGEDPARTYNVGSTGIDELKRVKLLSKEELQKELGFVFKARNVLVTFHPATLDNEPADSQFRELLKALDEFGGGLGIIFTKPNADTGGRALIAMLEEFVSKRPNAKAYDSLGQLRYLSVISAVDAVVGNSSSGLYEVPSFKKPTVNIGDRQKGRVEASSVINCKPVSGEIYNAIKQAFDKDCSGAVNPYGDGESVPRIIKILKETPDYGTLLKKHFFET